MGLILGWVLVLCGRCLAWWQWVCGGDCGGGRRLVVAITVGLICCNLFSMVLILGWVLISCNSWMGLICCNLLVDLVILV